tara:strand:- start:174 stop:3866 length:3693 start_codon:yes stop_codon:yes gene_type:complete
MDALENTEELTEIKSISIIKEDTTDTITFFNNTAAETAVRISPASPAYSMIPPTSNAKLNVSRNNAVKENLADSSNPGEQNKSKNSILSTEENYLSNKEISKEELKILRPTVTNTKAIIKFNKKYLEKNTVTDMDRANSSNKKELPVAKNSLIAKNEATTKVNESNSNDKITTKSLYKPKVEEVNVNGKSSTKTPTPNKGTNKPNTDNETISVDKEDKENTVEPLSKQIQVYDRSQLGSSSARMATKKPNVEDNKSILKATKKSFTTLNNSTEAKINKDVNKISPIKEKTNTKETDLKKTSLVSKKINEANKTLVEKPARKDNQLKVALAEEKEAVIDKVTYIQSGVAGQIKLRILKKQDSYTPGVKHTFLLQVENVGEPIENLDLDIALPATWDLISQSPLTSLKTNERKLILITFYIPTTYKSGSADFSATVKDNSGRMLGSDKMVLNIEENLKLEVHYTYFPENIEAGNLIEATYEIKNIGNTAQEISLNSKNTIKGKRAMTIQPNEIKTVKVTQGTDKRVYRLSYASTNLEVKSAKTGDVYRAFTNTQIFPSKIEKRDPFMRFPIQASLLYNSFTTKNDHYSTLSAELRGDGYLDMAKKHHLNFVFRGPKKIDLKRFGVADQYSVIYNYDDKTVVYLGDHGYSFDRLGFNSTYGLGFRIDQRVDKWTLSAMYSKPRIYTFNNEPVYGVKAQYHITDSLNLGVSVTRSKGNARDIYFSIPGNDRKEGQITVFNMNYRGNNTYVNAESSFSSSLNKVDFANFISGGIQFKNFSYAGNLTIGGSDYLGAMRNNLQFSNGLSFYKNRWSLSLGQNLSRINTSLDPIFYSVEPYYENYFASTGYTFNRNHNIRFRLDKRIREDKMEPSSFFYKEYGFEYNYSFSSNRFNFTFNGRIAQTKNMFAQELGYRKNYFNTINVNYRMYRFLTLRGSLNHNYTTRYGLTGNYSNNYRYNVGFNARINRNVRFTANYTSGFSPEDTYLQRDYITASLSARVRRRHLFALRGNYYQNPGVVNNKQFLAYGKYTYSFGIPIKRIIEQGGLQGKFYATGNGINFKGIRIISAGTTLSVKSNGVFEINNLPLGRNYVIVEESSLPKGVVSTVKMPIEINIEKGNLTEIDIPLTRAGKINGRLVWTGNNQTGNQDLKAYIKLSSDDFTYSLQSEKDGTFKFQDIVPGTYELSIIRFNTTDVYDKVKKIKVEVEAAKTQEATLEVGPKERKIRFNNKNFKVSN